MATEITEVELLEALRTALEQGDEGTQGLTTEEIAVALGSRQEAVRVMLRPLVRAGSIMPARAKRRSIDGSMRPVPVYRFVQEGAGGKDS